MPQAPTTIFTEDFQNLPTPTTVERIGAYTGTTGETYTGLAYYVSTAGACDGWIASEAMSASASAPIADCGGGATATGEWNDDQIFASDFGLAAGETTAAANANDALWDWTAGTPPTGNSVVLQGANIPYVATNRFVSMQADLGGTSCQTNGAALTFDVIDSAGTVHTNSSTPINPCTSTPNIGVADSLNARIGTYVGDTAFLYTGTKVGFSFTDAQTSGTGNDFGFDNIKLVDVTPQLDKSFTPVNAPVGGVSTLTFTITNTSELGAKNGWSLTDALQSGLTVASPSGATTTCDTTSGGTAITTPTPGTITVTNGKLDAGTPSCTVSVNVTSSTVTSYTNGPSQTTVTALNPPAAVPVNFVPAPDLSITKTDGSATYRPGQPNTYTMVVSNASDASVTATNALFADPAISNFTASSVACGSPTGGATCPSSSLVSDMQAGGIAIPSLPPGSSVTFTVLGTAGTGLGALTNLATITPASGGPNLGAACTAPRVFTSTTGVCSASDTDTVPSPQVTILKSTIGAGVTGSNIFNYALTQVGGTAITPGTDTISVAGALLNQPTGVTHAQTGTATAVKVAETLQAGNPTAFVANAALISCTDANQSIDLSPAIASVSAASSITIPAANMVPDAQISCTFANGTQPTVQIAKSIVGAVGPVTFGFSTTVMTPLADAGVPITTGNTSGSSVTIHTGTAGTAATVVEAAPPSPFSTNPITASCLDANGGPDGNGTAPLAVVTANRTVSLTGAMMRAGAQLTCTFTDGTQPTIQIKKATIGSITSTNTYTFTLSGGTLSSTTDSITFTGPGPQASATIHTQTSAATAVTVTEGATLPAGGFPANPVSISCVDANATTDHTTTPTITAVTSGALIVIPVTNMVPGAQILCTFTNGPLPTVQIKKTTIGALNSAVTTTFSYSVSNATIANMTTTVPGVGTNMTAVDTWDGSGTMVVNETGATPTTTFGLTPAPYTITCTDANALADNSPAIPQITNTASQTVKTITIPLVNLVGDAQITCEYVNGALPTMQIAKTTIGAAATATTTFSYALTFGANPTVNDSIPVTGSAANIASTTTFTGTVSQGVVVQESQAPGWAAAPTSITCADADGGNDGNGPGTLVTGAGSVVNFPATAMRAGAQIVCTFVNTLPTSTLTLTKTVTGRVGATDNFTVAVMNGATTVGSATTGTAGTSAATGALAITAGTTYTITDTSTPTTIGAYTQTIACTDLATGLPITATPTGSGTWSLTPGTDSYLCSITNGPAPIDVSITKTDNTTNYVPGQVDTYTVVVANSNAAGVGTATNVVVKDQTVAGMTYTSPITCAPVALCPATLTTTALNSPGLTIPSLAPGASVTFTIKRTVASTSVPTSLMNTATVAVPTGITDNGAACTTANGAGAFAGNVCTATDTDTLISPDLSITKTDGVTNYSATQSLTYTIVASNNGPGPATSPVLKDPLPTNVASYFSVTCAVTTGAAVCPTVTPTSIASGVTIPSMPANSALTFTLVAVVSATASGTIANLATITPVTGVTNSGVSCVTPQVFTPASGACSITDTDTSLAPTVSIMKRTLGAIPNTSTNTFSYTFTGAGAAALSSTTDSIPVTGADLQPSTVVHTQSGAGAALTLTETGTVPTGFATNANQISCVDSNAMDGAPAIAAIAGTANAIAIPATNMRAGAAIACTFVNGLLPTIQVAKTTVGPTTGTNTFSYTYVGATNSAFPNGDNVTVTGATGATPVTSPNAFTGAVNVAASVTEVPPPGWPTTATSISCVDNNGAFDRNGPATFGTLANPKITVPLANMVAGAQIVCSFVNTLPTSKLTLNKTVVGRVTASDNFTISIKKGATLLGSAVATGTTGTFATTGEQTVTAGTTYTLTETSTPAASLATYSITIVCTDLTTGVPATAVAGATGVWSFTPPNTDSYSCMISNSIPLLSCTTTSLYQGYTAGGLETVTPAGTLTPLAASILGAGVDGYAVNATGSKIYAVTTSTNSSTGLLVYDVASGVTSSLVGPTETGSPFANVGGAIDPVNGIYYFINTSSSGYAIYGYDTVNKVAIAGQVASIPFTPVAGTGDIAFDAAGNMWVLEQTTSAVTLARVAAAQLPSTGSTTPPPLTPLSVGTVAAAGLFLGLAFNGSGDLYALASGTNGIAVDDSLIPIDKNTGAAGTPVNVGKNADDLASCAYPTALTFQKNIAGRVNSGDQFSLSITGTNVTTGNTGVTSGNTTGQQTATGETAGPVIVTNGASYALKETGANGANLANYSVSATCVDTLNGNAPVSGPTPVPVVAGTATYTYPALSPAINQSVLCTFTNTPPTMSVTKVLAGSGRIGVNDQFTPQIRSGSSTGAIVGSPTISTGMGMTVDLGSGTTPSTSVTAGQPYFVNEIASNSNLNQYTATISCSDLNGVQTTGLPSGVALNTTSGYSITPVTGAALSCTITNTPKPSTVQVTKVSNGGTGSFMFSGTNGLTLQPIQTLTSGIGVSGAVQTLTTPGQPTVISETPVAGWAMTGGSCTGTADGSTGTVDTTMQTISLTAAATAAGSTIFCVVTDAKLPTVQIKKISNGGIGTFDFSGDTGFGPVPITTVASGVAVEGALQTLTSVSPAAATVTEAPTAGFTLSSVTCAGLTAGTDYSVNTTTGVLTLNPSATVAGAAINCTFTNTAATAVLSTAKVLTSINGNPATPGAVVHPGNVLVYTTTVTNTGTASGTTTVTETRPSGTTYIGTGELWTAADPTYTQPLTAPAGGTATAKFTVQVTSPAAAGQSSIVNTVTSSLGSCAAAACTVTDPLMAQLSVTKVVASRVAPGDDFTVSALDSTSTAVTSVTTHGEAAKQSTVVSVPVGANYTITEAAAVGSTNGLGSYVGTIGCTDTTTGGSVIPPGSAPSWTLTVGNADTYSCTVTNTPTVPSILLTKKASPSPVTAVGDLVTFTYQVQNNGTAPISSVTIAENSFTGSPALDVSGCAAQIGSLAVNATGNCFVTYAVNLSDKQLYEVPLTPGATSTSVPTAGTPTAIVLPLTLPGATQGCPGNLRPYGLGDYENTLYVTLTCDGPTTADLRGYVYSMNETTHVFSTAPVIELDMTYGRGEAIHDNPPGPNPPANVPANFTPWTNTAVNQVEGLLSTITFDAAGNASLSIKDRGADQFGFGLANPLPPFVGTTNEISAGELLYYCGSPSAGWIEENDGTCAGKTGVESGVGYGPGGGLFYDSSMGSDNCDYPCHEQILLGSALQLPGFNTIQATSFNPIPSGANNLEQDGFLTLSATNGALALYGVTDAGTPGYAAKSGGLGDLSGLIGLAPIEIGNRVWIDTNRDGLQDAGEPSVPGATVQLLNSGGTVLATAVTDSNGQYYFSSATGTSTSSAIYGITALVPGSSDVVKVPASNFATGSPLAGYVATLTTAGSDPTIDSNGVQANVAGDDVATVTEAPGTGSADHTFDFGFIMPIPVPVLANTGTSVMPVELETSAVLLILGAGLLAYERRRRRVRSTFALV